MSDRTIASPCTGICRMNDRLGLCQGCGRTLLEIATWAELSDGQRARVLAELETRPLPARMRGDDDEDRPER